MSQNSESRELQLEIEGVMKTLHNESYSEWVKNFAINYHKYGMNLLHMS